MSQAERMKIHFQLTCYQAITRVSNSELSNSPINILSPIPTPPTSPLPQNVAVTTPSAIISPVAAAVQELEKTNAGNPTTNQLTEGTRIKIHKKDKKKKVKKQIST